MKWVIPSLADSRISFITKRQNIFQNTLKWYCNVHISLCMYIY